MHKCVIRTHTQDNAVHTYAIEKVPGYGEIMAAISEEERMFKADVAAEHEDSGSETESSDDDQDNINHENNISNGYDVKGNHGKSAQKGSQRSGSHKYAVTDELPFAASTKVSVYYDCYHMCTKQ